MQTEQNGVEVELEGGNSTLNQDAIGAFRQQTRKAPMASSTRLREIMGYLRRFGTLSRTDLARLMSLNAVSMGEIIKLLLTEGWLKEVGEGVSSGGRRPIMLQIHSNNNCVIGLDVGGENIHAVATDLTGKVLEHYRQRTEALLGPEAVFERMVAAFNEVRQRLSQGNCRILGVGVGFSGMIDAEKGLCLVAPNLPGWQGIGVAEKLQAAIGMNVKLDDSSRLKLLAERQAIWPEEMDSTFLLDLGSGISGAFWVAGQIYRGLSGTAGELGHVIMAPEGPLCLCGSKGCLESLASSRAIACQAREGLKQGVMSSLRDSINGDAEQLTAEKVFDAAVKGDKYALFLIESAGTYIGSALAKVINLLNPTQVILTGGMSKMGDILLTPIMRTARAESLPMAFEKVKIDLSSAGDHAAAHGAALHYLDGFFAGFELKHEAHA
jgi:predicted NBD/HSP70 family sugar kinase